MIEPLECEAVHVGEVARELKFADLASAVTKVLCSIHPAVHKEQRMAEFLSATDHDAVRGEFAYLADHVADCLLFFRADLVPRAQLLEMRFDHPIPYSARTAGPGGMRMRKRRPSSVNVMSAPYSWVAILSSIS